MRIKEGNATKELQFSASGGTYAIGGRWPCLMRRFLSKVVFHFV
jgi:hypothetical protein